MKIGFDAKRLFHNFTGLGNYSRTLVSNLAEQFPEHEYHLFSPKLKKHRETKFFLENQPPFFTHHSGKVPAAFWRSFKMKDEIKKQEIDVFHGLSHELPNGIRQTKAKTVVTIHDLIFKIYPKLYPFVDRKIYDLKFRFACEKADAVVAISESTKQDIIRFYDIPEEKIKVIYQSCNSSFRVEKTIMERADILKKYDLPSDYLLYVGSVIERKNLLTIIKAMEQLPATLDIPLVVVGSGKGYLKKIQKYIANKPIGERIIFTKNIAFSDLPAIYQQAQLFIYPSVYEGFGIPIIEALNSSIPVITSPISSLPEAGGKSSLYVDPIDDTAMAAGISKILDDKHYRAEMIEKGLEYVRKFDAEKVTKEMMELYESL